MSSSRDLLETLTRLSQDLAEFEHARAAGQPLGRPDGAASEARAASGSVNDLDLVFRGLGDEAVRARDRSRADAGNRRRLARLALEETGDRAGRPGRGVLFPRVVLLDQIERIPGGSIKTAGAASQVEELPHADGE